METRHKTELKERMRRANKNWLVEVECIIDNTQIKTEFFSDKHTLENVLHCIELNLMTHLNDDLTSPIKTTIRRLEE